MLRTPSACAPSSSDSSAIRFRSRVVKWTRHSRSRSCWIPNATAIAPIRTRAIAESLMLTRSAPASRSSRAASIVRSMRTLRGGSISTEITKRPSASAYAEARAARSSSIDRGRLGRRGRGASPRSRPTTSVARPRARAGAPRPACRARRARRASRRCGRASCRSSRRRSARPASRSRGTIDAEVRRLGRVDELALEALRQAGVGHDRARRLAVLGRPEPRERVEAGQRPDAAVDADRVHARRGQRRDRRPRASCRRRARGPRRTSSTR